MKKLYFSGLIFWGLFLTAPQTRALGQNVAAAFASQNRATPAFESQNKPGGLIAYRWEHMNIVVLRWSGNSEAVVDHYAIEHSNDSVHFTPLHEVVSRGVDVSDSAFQYQDEDSYPVDPVNYYRLVTVLKNGSSIYSDPVRVTLDPRKTPILRPSVLQQGGTVWMDNFYEQPLIVDFYTPAGDHVGSYLVNGTSFNINTNGFNRGILIYRICDERHALINAGKILLQ